MRNRVIVRVIHALKELERGPHTWPTLAASLDCTIRQARRYVNALEEAHVPIRFGGIDTQKNGQQRRTIWIERNRL